MIQRQGFELTCEAGSQAVGTAGVCWLLSKLSFHLADTVFPITSLQSKLIFRFL